MKYWDKSVTLVENCKKVSEGCLHCWSETMAHRFHPNQTDPFGNWTGDIVCREDRLPELLKGRKPRVIQIWNDLFEESVSDNFITRAIVNMKAYQKHTFLILTKRAKRMADYVIKYWPEGVPNIFWGITCETQKYADERIPCLLRVPGKRWLSVEPLLEEINLPKECKGNIHGIITGAETGRNARPAQLQWFRNLRNQCLDMSIPFFLKQIDAKRNRILDGRTHDELPWTYSIKP